MYIARTFALTFFATLLLSGQVPAPEATGVIRSESRLVLVDTVVTDKKGNSVAGLTQKDFRVFEDNKEQTITSFSIGSGPSQDETRYTVLFFDNSTSGPAQAFARQAAAQFIRRTASPRRLFAIAEFGTNLTMRQNFTSDPGVLEQAVAAGGKSRGASGPAVNDAMKAARNEYTVRAPLEALQNLVKSLASLPGRKTVIFFSGGFSDSIEERAEMATTVSVCNRANVAVYPILASLAELRPEQASGGTGDSTPATANAGRRNALRNGLSMDDTSSGLQQSLGSLAEGTGGFLITNTDDVLSRLEKLGKEQEEYYMLGYTPSKSAGPGACHALKVRLEKSGDTVRSRSAYCEAVAYDSLSAMPAEGNLEAKLNASATPTVTGAVMQTAFFYTAADTARVHLALEIPPGAIKFTQDNGKFRAALNVQGIATLADGTVGSRFSDTVPLEMDDQQQANDFSARGYHYEKQFSIAPGKYELKVIFSSSPELFGRLETPLTVEPWTRSVFSLSGLALGGTLRSAKDAAPGLLTSGLLMSLANDHHVPLVANGFEIMPSGSNHYRRSGKAYLYAEVYEPAMAQSGVKEADIPAVGVRMELLDPATGKVKKDFGLTRLRLPPLTGSTSIPMGLVVSAPELEPGVYKLRVTALDATGHQATRTIDIQLEN